jgi:hypothetical protein
MPRTCTICINPCRDEIDKALVDSQPYRAVARQFGVSDDAVLRHIRPISVPIWEHAGKWGSEAREGSGRPIGSKEQQRSVQLCSLRTGSFISGDLCKRFATDCPRPAGP